MTDRETLFLYRLKQAEETLSEAQKMLEEDFSPKSILPFRIMPSFNRTNMELK